METASADLHKRIAGSWLEKLAGTGHALFVDDSPHFNSMLTVFLRKLLSTNKEVQAR